MINTKLTVINQKGLHARACSALSDLAKTFDCNIEIHFKQHQADAKNILQLMMLAAAQGSKVELYCAGIDEKPATQAIEQLFAEFFGEEA